jgi:hypothetical protein
MKAQAVSRSLAEMFVIAFRAMPRETQQIILDELAGTPPPDDQVSAQIARNEPALRLLHEWLADDTGYDECAWPVVQQTLVENRPSDTDLFTAQAFHA